MIDTARISDLSTRIYSSLARVIVGRDELKSYLLIALLAGGHVLIEGPPGTGKTKLAKTFADLIGGQFKRIQCVPDMLPADVTGFYMYSPTGKSRLVEGPIFANILVADELNRATPRTQAALLEAMQERQVTVERDTYPLPEVFMVIGTQQQTGAEGTYPLTGVQSDRFLFRYLTSHSSREEEARIIADIDNIDQPTIEAVTSLDEIREIRALILKTHVSQSIIDYITSLTEALRRDNDVGLTPSTRAAITLFKCGRVLAALNGRDFVIPDDIKALFLPALNHRVSVRAEAEMDELTATAILERVLERVPVPK